MSQRDQERSFWEKCFLQTRGGASFAPAAKAADDALEQWRERWVAAEAPQEETLSSNTPNTDAEEKLLGRHSLPLWYPFPRNETIESLLREIGKNVEISDQGSEWRVWCEDFEMYATNLFEALRKLRDEVKR